MMKRSLCCTAGETGLPFAIIFVQREGAMSRTIFITGASSGFGAACARLFAGQGDRLVLAARREAPLRDLAEELSAKTAVHAVAVDVRSRDEVRKSVEELPEEF